MSFKTYAMQGFNRFTNEEILIVNQEVLILIDTQMNLADPIAAAESTDSFK